MYIFIVADIGSPLPKGKRKLLDIQHSRSSKKYSTNEESFKLRIHATFNFDVPYRVRAESEYNKETNPEDVMFVRIESEPIYPLPFIKDRDGEFNAFSSVRQIVVNINESNLNKRYRPLMIFYSGPEKIDTTSAVRDSQPLILNLNADSRVVLFAPNSPGVINGNSHKMQGFVIAKEFVRLKTVADYTVVTEEIDGEIITRYYDDSGKEYFLKDFGQILIYLNRKFIEEKIRLCYDNLRNRIFFEGDDPFA